MQRLRLRPRVRLRPRLRLRLKLNTQLRLKPKPRPRPRPPKTKTKTKTNTKIQNRTKTKTKNQTKIDPTSFAQLPRSEDFVEYGGRRKGAVVFANRVEGRHSRDFVQVLRAVQKFRSLYDFGVNFLTGGTPEAFQAALEDQVGSQVDFFIGFRCPGGVFWRPCWVPLGQPWGKLGHHLGARSWQRKLEKQTSGVHCRPEFILRVQNDAPGHAE